MTDIESIRRSLSHEIESLNALIAAKLSSPNPLINEVISRDLSHKGKQLRPMMVILTASILGATDSERVISSAAAIEMLHNASLIHDDVIDQSPTRHGKPTINTVWDNHIAVLMGDYFMSTALQLITTTGDLRAIEALASLGRLLSTGEMDQINYAANHSISEEAYFEIITHKTASMFIACVEMGAYAAAASAEKLDKMKEFARIFGQCFQIKDDIFDYSPSDILGKPTGNDLREGKITLPLIHALGRTDLPECSAMNELAARDNLSDQEIASLINYAIEAGGIQYANDTLLRLRNEASGVLASFGDADTTPLLTLLDYIIDRDN